MTGNSNERRHPRRYYVSWILRQYRGLGWLVALMVVLTALSTVAAVLMPQLLGHLIDRLTLGLQAFKQGGLSRDAAMAERTRNLLLLLALGFGPVIGAVYPWLRLRMNLFFEQRFRERFFRDVLGREPGFFLRFRTGDLVTRLTDNLRCAPSGLPWLCCSGIFRAMTAAGIIVCCLLGMFSLHRWLALAALIPLPLMLWLFLRLQTTLENRCEAVQEKVSETTAFLESAFSGIRIIKSFTAEKARHAAFGELLGRRRELELVSARTEGLLQIYFEFLTYLGEILVLAGGGVLVAQGSLSLGAYYAFFSYLGMILPTVMDIPMLMVTLSQAFVVIDRLEELERAPVANQPGTRKTADAPRIFLSEPFGSMVFKGVGFAYPIDSGGEVGAKQGRPFRLSPLSFELRRGEKVAVMGPIGSGKTTLLHLVAGLFDPACGEILINGRRLGELNQAAWREGIGFVEQEPVVFSETAGWNIDFWRGLDEDRVRQAAGLAQIQEEIEGLPGGFGERLGTRGVGLSGGQRQRLSLARALAGQPGLLLMDDVTAGLDAANERLLWRRLRATEPGQTCLIVTHRAATARVADRILVLDDGRLVASGEHQDLLRDCPLYRELIGARPTAIRATRLAA